MGVIKVLQVMAGMDCGGVETFAMNILRSSEADKVKFDFAEAKSSPSFYDEEIKQFGSNIFYCGKASQNPLKYLLNLVLSIKKGGPYDAVHCQMLFFSAVPLFVAFFLGVPVRICHSHATNRFRKRTFIRKIYEFITRRIILLFATDLLACSDSAGRALYGDKAAFKIIPNGINCADFEFKQNTRAQVRERLGLGDSFVIGNVGRFFKVKNQSFLTEALNLLLKDDKNIKLMLIGSGELEETVKNKAAKLGIKDNILFMGLRNDTSKLMQAMDLFAMPSLYEGLPLAGVEAQAAGLPCLFTENLTREMDIFKCSYIPLNPEVWKDEILKLKGQTFDRAAGAQAVRKAGFDINDAAAILLKIYKGEK